MQEVYPQGGLWYPNAGMPELVFDIETQTANFTFDEAGLKTARISVVVVYDYADGQYKTFMEENIAELWPLLEKADRVIGYNIVHFDLPVLNNYYSGDLLKLPNLDLIIPVREALGFRLKLNDIAKATLKVEKSADGLQAVKWWAEGNVEDIKKYCEQDVRVTKDIYEFGRKNKQLFYSNLQGALMTFPVNFDPPMAPAAASGAPQSQSSLNLTLPL